MVDPLDDVKKYYESVAKEYQNRYQEDGPRYPANLKRLDILLDRTAQLGVKTLLDCGCGEGTPMRNLAAQGIDVWGFDFVPEMIDFAKVNLGEVGLSERVWVGDITDLSTFSPTGIETPEQYDATIAMGVFPHMSDEPATLENMIAVTRPGGHIFVEFRNVLFSLFTVNRFSYELLARDLINFEAVKQDHPEYAGDLETVQEELKRYFQMDAPPHRPGKTDMPGYDDILAQFRNPLTIHTLFEEVGLVFKGLHFYHYHAVPPIFARINPDMFRQLSLEMEADPRDWRGYFMCSAFVVEAQKES